MKNLKLAAALALGLAVSGPACAGVITIGTGTGGNGFPFSSSSYAGEYQQVYNGALFSGPVDITQISFFNAPGLHPQRHRRQLHPASVHHQRDTVYAQPDLCEQYRAG